MNASPLSLTASAAALFSNADGDVLIVNPTYKKFWNLPGGAVDEDETPHEAVAREVREELGITPPVDRLLVHAWVSVPGRGAQVLYVFDGGVLSPEDQAAITLQEEELSEYRFCQPDSMEDGLVPPHLTDVWQAALAARSDQHPRVLTVRL
ncbi:NUDIX domain-containing protein [Streptomyces himalayensis]|uniref:NUDIX hydrolase n=1 Tax=Streptomyces himalayensis subsp. himalayensis TaxID=2756131 RepID=A0A7W0DSA4_9ACTN|nr:NUDIX hydrolase [Streptomyces himalayensis]MBA2950317.1 NUDIX hydrolase [Streptomyces himalayensis subsp. himalayensis]